MQIQKVFGTFNGTAAPVYMCIGAVPVSVRLINAEVATNPIEMYWNRAMVPGAIGGGVIYSAAGVPTKLTNAQGINIYEGGDLITSDNQVVTYGEGSFLGWDMKNYQADNAYGAVSGSINRWTFETGLTGHFNVNGVASGCRIGIGSVVRIREDASGLIKEATITALTSTPDFTTTVYVTLSRAIGSGTITFIGGMYQFAPIALGKVAPAGFWISGDSLMDALNVNDDIVAFEAEIEIQ